MLKSLWGRAVGSDFVRKVAETYATQISLIIVGLATTITVARILGPEGRGLYAVALAIGQVGVQFGHFGLLASNTYFLGKDRSVLPTLVGNSLFLSGAVFVLAAAICGPLFYLWPKLAPVHGLLLVLGFVYIPLGLTFQLSQNLLIALQQVRSYNKVELMNRLFILVLIGSVALLHRVNPQSVFAANILVMLLSAVATLLILKPFVNAFPKPSLQLLRQHFGLGIKAYLIILFSYLLLRVDLLMVKYMLGAEQAGYYSVASSMADYVLMLPGVIGMILFAKLTALQDWADKLRQARNAALGTAAALVPLLCIAGIAVYPIVRLMFGKAFLPSGAAFLWLLPGIFSLGVETVAVQFLNSLGYPRIVVWVWLSSVVLNIAGNLWTIPHMGIAGASLMSSISYTLTFLAILAVVYRKRKELQTAHAL